MSNTFTSALVGCELIQIAIGQYPVILRFDKHVSISVEHALEWRAGNESFEWIIHQGSLPQRVPWLHLISHRIVEAHQHPDQSLEICFDNQEKLICRKGTAGFESYQVNLGGDVWVF